MQNKEELDQDFEAVKAAYIQELENLPGEWYVLYTQTGKENTAKQNLETSIINRELENIIHQVEVPIEEVVEYKKSKRKLVKKVRTPGYIYIRMDLTGKDGNLNDQDNIGKAISLVRATPGIAGFVGGTTDKSPIPISTQEIADILLPAILSHDVAQEQMSSNEPILSKEVFEVGETIVVIDGPFIGLPGTIESLTPEVQKANVLMTIANRETPIELSYNQISKEQE